MQTNLLLVGIFLLAIFLRFLYFPDNIYFGFDQARDAFAALEILQGNLKIIGPPTGVEGLFHGPLYYYLFAPFYFFSQGDPIFVAGFLRVINALGVLVIFVAGRVIFNTKVGLFSALLFALSFEQTQYALYFNHPSLAVVPVILFYLGLSLIFFQKEQKGLILTLLALGLSLQFEFVLVYLFLILLVFITIFKNFLPEIKKRMLIISLLVLGLTLSSFILAEIKFQFRTIPHLISLITSSSGGDISQYLHNIYLLLLRFVGDNLILHTEGTKLMLIFIVVISFVLMKNIKLRPKVLFLLLWTTAGILPYLNNKSATPLYYYSVGASGGLLIFYSLVVNKLWEKSAVWGAIFLIIPIFSNLNLIKQNNIFGVIPTINVQSGMLLSSEKMVLDYIYQEAAGQPFATSGVTMPLLVNTTWSYLFEWYGQKKYGYLPIWGDNIASGYPGNLMVVTAKSTLPQLRFFIIEPTRGIRWPLVENLLREENYFTEVLKEEKIRDFIVQTRRPI